jgi:linoleoyl-CoA desaturase
VVKVHPEQPWRPAYLVQPIYDVVLAVTFEYGIALRDLELERAWRGEKSWSMVLG